METLNIITVLGLLGGSFISTNLDNLVLLVLLQKMHPRWRLVIACGFLSACAVTIGLSLVVAMVGDTIDPQLIGLLGFIPIGIGVYALYRQFRHRVDAEISVGDEARSDNKMGLFFGTLALMLANSGDTFAVMLPLLADTSPDSYVIILLGYAICATLWMALAWRLSDNQALAMNIESLGQKWVPLIMIGVGVYIVLNTATDTLN